MASNVSLIRSASRTAAVSIAVFTAFGAMAGNAFAVSLRVQIACASDYYAHRSAYSPSGPEVRTCMRKVGVNLSKTCINALIAAGEVPGVKVARKPALAETASK